MAREFGRHYRVPAARAGGSIARDTPALPAPTLKTNQAEPSGAKRKIYMLDAPTQAMLTQMQREGERLEMLKKKRCGYCKVMIAFPISVNPNKEKTIWEMHVESASHKLRVEDRYQNWDRICDP